MSKQKDLIPISVTVQGKKGAPSVLEFTQESVIIGSGPSANVKLEDESISSIHAMIKNKGAGKVVVLDLGSENGTQVNGEDVVGETELQDGDKLAVGAFSLTVNVGGHVQDTPTEPDRPPPGAREKPKGKVKQVQPDVATEVVRPHEPERFVEQRTAQDHAAAWHPPFSDMDLFAGDLRKSDKPSDSAKVLEVVMMWGDAALEVAHLRKAAAITIGEESKNTFQVPPDLLPTPVFSLVRGAADGCYIDVAQGFDIDVRRNGDTVGLEVLKSNGELKAAPTSYSALSYRLGLNDCATVKVGDLKFVVRYISPSSLAETAAWETFDYYFGKLFAASFIAHAMLFFAFLITPVDTGLGDEDLFKNPNKFAKLMLTKPEDKKDDLSGKKGAKAKDDEGKFGKKDKPQKDAMPSKKGAPTVDVNKRERDRKIALNAGALGILRKMGAGAVDNVFGPGGLGTGQNNALGGLTGAGLGDAGGAGGLGTRGTGPGGGGNALGIGGLGSGTGRGSGGRGDIDLGGRGKGATRIIPGKTIVEGSLSKEEIGRVIRRYLNQIKYCYEKELQKNPNLYGKVVVMFQIGGTGNVNEASVVQSSLNDNNCEECVLRIIRRLRFPQPRGGGIVVVTYPFIFQQSGGG